MKFTCSTKELNTACNNVIRAVSAKVTIPTIEGILMECNNDKLRLTGYDFEFGINTTLNVDMEEAGEIVINAKTLCDIIKKIEEEEVSLETNGNSVTIFSSAVKYDITGIDAKEYPELPSVTGGYPLEIEQKLLHSMITQTVFAVADNESSNPVCMGLKFSIESGELVLVGVDGYRLAIRKEKINYTGDDISFIVPKKTIRELLKLMDTESDKGVLILVGRRHIVFEVEEYTIISRLLEGNFIDYKMTLKNAVTATVLINTNDAVKCIDKALPVIENNQKNPIKCIFDNDEMRVSSVSSIGRVVISTHANTSGDRIEIGFNSRFMLDALSAADTDEIRIELSGPESPAKIMPIEGEDFIFLVLPMRLKNEN